MCICYGNWSCFEKRRASSNPGSAFGVKRIFDFLAALWLKMNAPFYFPSCCVCLCTHACAQVRRFSFSEAIRSLDEMNRFETDGSLQSEKPLCIGER